jgi:hypothetical protein
MRFMSAAEKLISRSSAMPVVGSGAGGHVGGQDVVRVAVEVLTGPVVAQGGAWVGVAGGDLDVSQVHARIQHGGDEGADVEEPT